TLCDRGADPVGGTRDAGDAPVEPEQPVDEACGDVEDVLGRGVRVGDAHVASSSSRLLAESCPHGMGIVAGLRCRSRRTSLGRSLNQFTNRTSCVTASLYARSPFSTEASSGSPRTPVSL